MPIPPPEPPKPIPPPWKPRHRRGSRHQNRRHRRENPHRQKPPRAEAASGASMATEANANRAIIVLRNITHLPDPALELDAFSAGFSLSRRKSRTTSRKRMGNLAHFYATEISRSTAAANALDLAIDLLVLLGDRRVTASLRTRNIRTRSRSCRTRGHAAAGVDPCLTTAPYRPSWCPAQAAWPASTHSRAARVLSGIVQPAGSGRPRRNAADALRTGAGGARTGRASGAAAAASGG